MTAIGCRVRAGAVHSHRGQGEPAMVGMGSLEARSVWGKRVFQRFTQSKETANDVYTVKSNVS